MKIIFLDFDGVLNSEKYVRAQNEYGVIIDPEKMLMLKHIIDKTNAKTVLSTSWREHWDKDSFLCDETGKQINEIFKKYGIKIYDKTPFLKEGREQEILCWLNCNKDTESFVVLDDRFLSADYLYGHFVKTSGYRNALTKEDAVKAIEILNANNKRKLFVVSDIHGHYTLLKEALDNAGYDSLNDNHLLVCNGDYFDRGNENVQVLKFFERIKNKVLLRGNHEDSLIKLLKTGKLEKHHYINGTFATLENFFGKYSIDPTDDSIDFSGKNRTVDRLLEFMESTLNFYETENHLFIHGWLPENCNNTEQIKKATDTAWAQARRIRWTAKYTGEPPLTKKTLVCGHMPAFYSYVFDNSRDIDSADIFYGNKFIAIDAGTADSKQVNVLVLEDNLI